jgi:hypothetical protein
MEREMNKWMNDKYKHTWGKPYYYHCCDMWKAPTVLIMLDCNTTATKQWKNKLLEDSDLLYLDT